MMWWWDDGPGWAAWLVMSLSMLLFWVLVIWGVVVLARRPDGGDVPTGAPRDPEQLLAERYARGEIGDEEYRRRREALRQGISPRV